MLCEGDMKGNVMKERVCYKRKGMLCEGIARGFI